MMRSRVFANIECARRIADFLIVDPDTTTLAAEVRKRAGVLQKCVEAAKQSRREEAFWTEAAATAGTMFAAWTTYKMAMSARQEMMARETWQENYERVLAASESHHTTDVYNEILADMNKTMQEEVQRPSLRSMNWLTDDVLGLQFVMESLAEEHQHNAETAKDTIEGHEIIYRDMISCMAKSLRPVMKLTTVSRDMNFHTHQALRAILKEDYRVIHLIVADVVYEHMGEHLRAANQ